MIENPHFGGLPIASSATPRPGSRRSNAAPEGSQKPARFSFIEPTGQKVRFSSVFVDTFPGLLIIPLISFATSSARCPVGSGSASSPQHACKQAPCQMALRQQQSVIAGMLDWPSVGLHQPLLQGSLATTVPDAALTAPSAVRLTGMVVTS